MAIEMTMILGIKHFGPERIVSPAAHAADYSNTAELGRLLYTDYVYPFELASVILLVAIVAAIALTLRRRKDSKYIDPAEQVRVKRNDRLKIISMPAEIDTINRKIIQLEIERQSLKKETDKTSNDRRDKLEGELADLKANMDQMKLHWSSEKDNIKKIQHIKIQMENLKTEKK